MGAGGVASSEQFEARCSFATRGVGGGRCSGACSMRLFAAHRFAEPDAPPPHEPDIRTALYELFAERAVVLTAESRIQTRSNRCIGLLIPLQTLDFFELPAPGPVAIIPALYGPRSARAL